MNYLAHLLLAGEDSEERLGSLIGDFARGRLERLAITYPPGIMRGIAIHRKIDQYTDRHALMVGSRGRFSTRRRRYAGIIVDVLNDHFLSHHWDRYCATGRERFIADSYRLLQDNHHRLPAKLQRVSLLMVEQDWLGGYHRIDRIGEVYDRMSRRLPRANALDGAIDEVMALYPLLEQDFHHFFPDLYRYVEGLSQNGASS